MNAEIRERLASNNSGRRIAFTMGINRKTVARKVLFIGRLSIDSMTQTLQKWVASGKLLDDLQMDEMETFEHSKCKPLSIPLMVHAPTYAILGFGVCSMPAKGPLAAISRKKYGPRGDHRPQTAIAMLSRMVPFVSPTANLLSDQNPKYPGWVRRVFPEVKHTTVKGRRGCVVGQGELKKTGHDPLFALNHSCAMLRANINRLGRKTWCTTKKMANLEAHIALYAHYHNYELKGVGEPLPLA